MLGDAQFEINGRTTPAMEIILGTGGPLLSANGRAWLLELARRPLGLYEVREVSKGKGLFLADMAQPDEPPVWVEDKAAADSLVRWDTFGARLLRQDDSFVISGATYPIDRRTALNCLDEILGETDQEDDPQLRREITACSIIDCWLDAILDEGPMPQLVDASTGGKIILTTDHYRVKDWEALEEALAKQVDVDGDRDEGWTRFIEADESMQRTLASLTAKAPDTLEVFCRTTALADAARSWLENIAGSAIHFTIRDLVDPRSPKAQASAKPLPEPDIPQEVQRQIIHQYLTKHYQTWPEIPLPALNGKAPLEAVKTKQGRMSVINLLKSIEVLEARRIAQTGGDPLDVTFLWERLGLRDEMDS